MFSFLLIGQLRSPLRLSPADLPVRDIWAKLGVHEQDIYHHRTNTVAMVEVNFGIAAREGNQEQEQAVKFTDTTVSNADPVRLIFLP